MRPPEVLFVIEQIASAAQLHSGKANLKLEFFVASLVAWNLDVVAPVAVAMMQAEIGTEKAIAAVMIDVGAVDLVVAALPVVPAGFAAAVVLWSLVVDVYA